MVDVFWNSETLMRHPIGLADPQYRQIQIMHAACLNFLEWILTAFDHLKLHHTGTPRKICNLEGVDGYKRELIGGFLHQDGIHGSFFALGVEFVGKGAKREARVSELYVGLSANLCYLMCCYVEKRHVEKPGRHDLSALSVGPLPGTSVNDTPNPASVSIEVATNDVGGATKSVSTGCDMACAECTALRKKKKLLQQQVCRLKAKLKKLHSSGKNDCNEESLDAEREAKANTLVKYVEQGGAYFSVINGVSQLSVVAGVLLNDLRAHCGVSLEKMSLVITNVFMMIFGDSIGEAFYRKVIRATSTYDVAMQRAGSRITEDVKCAFNGSIQSAHLIIDDSNKGVDLSVMPYSALHDDGSVRSSALLTVRSYTKKAQASDRLIASIVDQIGESGLTYFTSGTTDNFGAAVKTLRTILAAADTAASAAAETAVVATANPQLYESLKVKSNVTEGLVYDFTAPVRTLRLFACGMHSLERCLAPLLDRLQQEQGIANEAHTSQLLYLCHYVVRKAPDEMATLRIMAAGGVQKGVTKICDVLKKFIGKVAPQRWVSKERTSYELTKAMDIAASELLIDTAAAMYGGRESADWKSLLPYVTCFTSPAASHYVLLLLIMCNHSTTEQQKLVWRVIGFLAAPAQRIAICLTASMYPIHMEFAEFLDGHTTTHNAIVCSTRAFELVDFQRKLINKAETLCRNWSLELPAASQFLHSEAQRAATLGLAPTSDVYINKYNGIMHDGLNDMQTMVAKHFYAPSFGAGISILHLTSAHTAPHFCAVLLEYLQEDGLLPPTVPPLVTEYALEEKLYPNATATEFRSAVKAGLSNHDERFAVYRAYGLAHVSIIKEMVQVHEEKGGGWGYVKCNCPVMFEMLSVWFSAVSITGTLAEQSFSSSDYVIDTSSAESTNVGSLQHFQIVRRHVVDQSVRLLQQSGDPKIPKRPIRAFSSRMVYSKSLLAFGVRLSGYSEPVKSVAALKGHGKRLNALLNNKEDIISSMTSNYKKTRVLGRSLPTFAAANDSARLQNLRVLPAIVLTPTERAEKFTKSKLQWMLTQYSGIPPKNLTMSKSALVTLVVKLWETMDPYYDDD